MLWKDSKGGEVKAAHWGSLPGNRGQSASEEKEINLFWNMMGEPDEAVGKRLKEGKKWENCDCVRFLVCGLEVE